MKKMNQLLVTLAVVVVSIAIGRSLWRPDWWNPAVLYEYVSSTWTMMAGGAMVTVLFIAPAFLNTKLFLEDLFSRLRGDTPWNDHFFKFAAHGIVSLIMAIFASFMIIIVLRLLSTPWRL